MKPKKLEAQKEEVITYNTVMSLNSYYGRLALPMKTVDEVIAATDRKQFLNKIGQEFNEKMNAIDYSKDKDGKENSKETIKKLKDEQFVEMANDDKNPAIGVTKENLAFLTMKEFVEAIQGVTNVYGLPINIEEITFLRKWFVKEDSKAEEAEAV